MATSQIIGFTVGNTLEIESATKAARVTFRPEDYGSLGIYSLASTNTTNPMSAGLGGAAPIFSARWTHATNLALIKRITFSVGAGATAFAAGVSRFDLFVARSWSLADSSGSAIVPTGNQNKMRTSGMGTTLFATGDIRISAAVTLTAGTRTLDANPIASLAAGVLATAGSLIIAPFAMFDQRPGEHPLILAQNEGLVLQATVPATGTWMFAVKMDWTEITAY